MRLIECHIENFGTFSDLDITFDPAFHRICEPNGWGKSTLAAFIRVMFFGFEGEGKRKKAENERKRYAPWQGGVYGGRITFETNGRIYTVARVFSNKKADDRFELRDAQTNLASDDFTENLGEELFRINAESFARTVFIGQNDCATRATDSINAKIGDIADGFGDLDRFEQAAAALKDAQNKLTPERKTGMLYRMNEEITRLQTQAAQSASLEEAIAACGGREEAARAELTEIRRQQDEAFALAGEVSRAQDQKAKRETYAGLCEACDRTEEIRQRAETYFPGEILSEEEIAACMTTCGEMNQAAEAMRRDAFDKQEEAQLAEWEPERNGEDGRSEKSSGRWPGFLIGGVIALVVGLVLYIGVWRFWPWLVVAAAGVALLAAGGAFGWRARQRKEQRMARERERTAHREALEEKQRRFLSARTQYEEKRAYVEERIRRTGLAPQEDLAAQLQEIWRQTTDLQNARKEAETARRRKEAFKNSEDGRALAREAQQSEREPLLSAEELPSMEELHEAQLRLENAANAVRERVDSYAEQLASLREQYDACAEAQERLAEACEERARRTAQYEQIGTALSCLATAKETLTAKYRDPLLTSFSEYYRIATGDTPKRFQMDANANLTVEAYGLQRETEYLSRGWQDLTGLCFRLALVDAMYPGEKPFLILDDPLVSLDDEKRAGGMRLIGSLTDRCQVIYFTCRSE